MSTQYIYFFGTGPDPAHPFWSELELSGLENSGEGR